MNLSRRELDNKENKGIKRENDSEKKDNFIKKTLRSGEKLLVAGVLSAGLVLGACGSAKTDNMRDAETEGTIGSLPGFEDTRTEDSVSDLIDEDIIEDTGPEDVPDVEMDVTTDIIEDSEELDAATDSEEDVAVDLEDADSEEDITADSGEDVSIDSDLDAAMDTSEDIVDEEIGDVSDVSGDLSDADMSDVGPEDSVEDSAELIESDTVSEEDASLDVSEDETDAGDVVTDASDVIEEDVDGDTVTLTCIPYNDSIVEEWISTGTTALVGDIHIRYSGMSSETGAGLYDIICGGTILRSDIAVDVGATVTVDVLEMGFRAIIEANSVSVIGTNSDIEIQRISSSICSPIDTAIPRPIILNMGYNVEVDGIGFGYGGVSTSGNPLFSLYCGTTAVRSGIEIPLGTTHTEVVPEHHFTIAINPNRIVGSSVRLRVSVDAH